MGEPTVLLWVLTGFLFVLLLIIVFAVSKLWTLGRELGKLNQALNKLDARISEQERQLAEVRAVLGSRHDSLLEPFVEAFKKYRSQGWLSALTLLGSHLFRSYLSKKRQKALPKKGPSE